MPTTSSGSAKVFYPRHSREELIDLLRRRLPSLGDVLPLKQVVLFGSWATGRATAFSDIDLLVVYAGAPRADAYGVTRACFQLRGLELHIYTEAEALCLGPTLERMTRDGVTLL